MRPQKLRSLLMLLMLPGGSALALPPGAAAEPPVVKGLAERLAPASQPAPAQGAYKEVGWPELVPKDWQPFKGLDVNAALNDGDPRALKLLKDMRAIWDNAPVEPSLNRARVRIPGYVVPLEGESGKVREFLLVPYFGACIHSPPPPANQIIHAVSAKPLELRTMDAVWVSGVMETLRSDSRGNSMGLGTAGYRMAAEIVVPFKAP